MQLIAEIEILKDLTQIQSPNGNVDLHNEFICKSILFDKQALKLEFVKLDNGFSYLLQFHSVAITHIDFLFELNTILDMTVDTLYRGRYEVDGKLFDLSDDRKGYMYLEFVEGQKMEFWAMGMSIEESIVDKPA